MSPANYHLGLLATLTLVFLEVIGTSDSTAAPAAVYVPCEGGSKRLLQLEELIHISDVVMYGVVLSSTITQEEFGTFKGSISYYYAYKNDPLLRKRGLSSVYVSDFPQRPTGESSLFFLVRQPNAELSLYCMSTLSELDNSLHTVYDGLYELIEKVKKVAAADVEKNRNFVLPYPNPCDSNLTNTSCSSVGSYCTLKNTLTNETSRCTCIFGFHGDGFTCSPRTDGAAKIECPQCTHGARCVISSQSSEEEQGNSVLLTDSQDREDGEPQPTIDCDCQHYKCADLAARMLCATDGVTYTNECHMRREACHQQKDIFKLHNGRCRPNSAQPCSGLGTPLSTSAGLVTCSATRQCPTMHFCHSTDTFAVCCPVTAPASATTQRWVTVATTTSATPSSGSGEWNDNDLDGEGSGSGATDIENGVTTPALATTQRWVTVATTTSATPSSGSGEWNDHDRDGESSGSGATDIENGDRDLSSE